jgi:hypothetical protein
VLFSGGVVVCCIEGAFLYGREEAGARVSSGGSGGKISGRGGSGDVVGSRGQVVGDTAPPRACWRRSMTSATVSSRALRSVTGRRKRWLFHRPQPGSGRAPMRDRQRRSLGRRRVPLHVRGRTTAASSTVESIFLNFAHQLFGQMPA